MNDIKGPVRVAAVQAASVFLNKDATVDKACALIREAGRNGARLVALPETFIPGYPYWISIMDVSKGGAFNVRLFENSVPVPGPETAALGAAAREVGAYVVIGVNERGGRALYNTLLFFGPDGRLLGKRRKLKGTFVEKAIWADGDASTHEVYDTAIGKLSGLICGEHTMALPGYSLAQQGEEIHIAAWVGFCSALDPERRKRFRNMTESCARYHATAFNAHVINTQSHVDEETLRVLGNPPPELLSVGGGWTAIIAGGTAEYLAGPLVDEEGILYADLDVAALTPYFFARGTSPFFSVLVDQEEKAPLRRHAEAEAPRREGDEAGAPGENDRSRLGGKGAAA